MGYEKEMWGSYKALVDGALHAVVKGTAYEVRSAKCERRLAAYETGAYKVDKCDVHMRVDHGSITETIRRRTFKHAGDTQALGEERSDRNLWMRNRNPDLWVTVSKGYGKMGL